MRMPEWPSLPSIAFKVESKTTPHFFPECISAKREKKINGANEEEAKKCASFLCFLYFRCVSARSTQREKRAMVRMKKQKKVRFFFVAFYIFGLIKKYINK